MAEGRLHLSAVIMLAPHLIPETAEELLKAAAHKSKSEIEQLLAERFPRPDISARVEPLSPPPALASPERLAPGPVEPLFSATAYAQELLSHQVSSGDVTEVLHRALKALIGQLEKTKFAATCRPRHSRGCPKPGARHIPAEVKRVVWQRDGGQCTFVGESGRRCPARALLEFDHMDEVARGGQATADRMRLRCRAHNQYGAEQAFGTEFMNQKRQADAARGGGGARESSGGLTRPRLAPTGLGSATG